MKKKANASSDENVEVGYDVVPKIKSGIRQYKNLEVGGDFFDRLWEQSWTYIKTVVDVVREPVLILNKDFCILAANDPFYKTFQVKRGETEGKIVYELGNAQWDILALRNLLEDILPKHTYFKGFQVAHEFPGIGRKVMILNARQIHFQVNTPSELHSPIILLAIEDITEMLAVAEKLAIHVNQFESKLSERTYNLEIYIKKLEEEINKIKANFKGKK